jgi:hypothetical protein
MQWKTKGSRASNNILLMATSLRHWALQARTIFGAYGKWNEVALLRNGTL